MDENEQQMEQKHYIKTRKNEKRLSEQIGVLIYEHKKMFKNDA